MTELPNVEGIYRQEKRRWLKEEAPHKAIRDRIVESVPYWIILVALVLFGLSAPHTASVFDKLTPGWGWIAPIGVEFGLLYSAFQRRLAHTQQQSSPWSLWVLELLLFITAMLVNGAGSFTSVVASSQLEGLSSAAIWQQFGGFPATTQAALIMAVLAAFIIPIGALVAGEGLAALALAQPSGQNFQEQQWQAVEFTLLYRAVFVAYLQGGLPEREARQRALQEVRGYLPHSGPRLSNPSALSRGAGQPEPIPNGQPSRQVKPQIRAFLAQHPELAGQSVNQVLAQLKQAGLAVGRTSVAQVLQEERHA